jgi:hypothetical protein
MQTLEMLIADALGFLLLITDEDHHKEVSGVPPNLKSLSF